MGCATGEGDKAIGDPFRAIFATVWWCAVLITGHSVAMQVWCALTLELCLKLEIAEHEKSS